MDQHGWIVVFSHQNLDLLNKVVVMKKITIRVVLPWKIRMNHHGVICYCFFNKVVGKTITNIFPDGGEKL